MKLAAIGSNCIDYYNNMDGGKAFAGGGPVNMAVYTIRLGGTAAYIGAVGNDAYGQQMQEAMEKKGVDVSHLYVKEGKTAVSQVRLIDGERVFGAYEEGVLADFALSEEDMEFISKQDMVVADLWGRMEGYFEQLKGRGIVTAFDCANRPDAVAANVAIPYTDYLFFSADEGDTPAVRAKMMGIQKKGPIMVIAMLGSQGSLCFDGKRFVKGGIKACENLVDSMGAGDSYIAGFLTGIQKGKSLEEAMALGAETATETLGYFGAW
ncbi:MAG: fructoselysine 6-kinase [Lachnospiraceae bacterium]|nr:fructoselysine 6-kinase [Lachnospiraceae bacterium]